MTTEKLGQTCPDSAIPSLLLQSANQKQAINEVSGVKWGHQSERSPGWIEKRANKECKSVGRSSSNSSRQAPFHHLNNLNLFILSICLSTCLSRNVRLPACLSSIYLSIDRCQLSVLGSSSEEERQQPLGMTVLLWWIFYKGGVVDSLWQVEMSQYLQ